MSHQFRVSQPRVERCGDGTYLCPTCRAKAAGDVPRPYRAAMERVEIEYDARGVPRPYAADIRKLREENR